MERRGVSMNKTRVNQYDLLKIMSTIAVIVIHVSGYCIQEQATVEKLAVYLNVFSRYAVPCFLMISGALILSNDKNADYRFYYRKVGKNIGIPTIIFSVIYVVYSLIVKWIRLRTNGEGDTNLLGPIINMIKGEPFYHMWYLYRMIGVYVLIPIVIKVKKEIGEKNFDWVSCIFLILASFSVWTSTHKLNWDIGLSFCYLGYPMIGYTIYKKTSNQKKKYKVIIWIMFSLILLWLIGYVRYQQIIKGNMSSITEEMLIGPYSPGIVLASASLFIGISLLPIKVDFSKLSSLTFYIYLFHAIVWAFILPILNKIQMGITTWWMIPISTIFVFVISCICAVIYKKGKKIINNFSKNKKNG